MTYNMSIAENITGVGTSLGFINVNANGLFFVLMLLTLVIIISMYAIRNGLREFRAVFLALTLTTIPLVLLAAMSSFDVPFLPAWYVLLHLTLLAISGVFAYFNK